MKKIITALLLAVCMMSLTACKSTISGHVAGKVLEGLMAKDSEKDKEDNDGKTKDVKDQEEQSKGENKDGQDEGETGQDTDSRETEEAGRVSDNAEKNSSLELRLEKRYLKIGRAHV